MQVKIGFVHKNVCVFVNVGWCLRVPDETCFVLAAPDILDQFIMCNQQH